MALLVLQGLCIDVDAVVQKALLAVGEAHVEQLTGREARLQDRPVFIVHHRRRAIDAALDQIEGVRSLLNDPDAVSGNAQRPQPVANLELVASVPNADRFARNICGALEAGAAPANDGDAGMPEDLRDVDDVMALQARGQCSGKPCERDVGIGRAQPFDRRDAGATLDDLEVDALAGIVALAHGYIDAGELRLVCPHELQAQLIGRFGTGWGQKNGKVCSNDCAKGPDEGPHSDGRHVSPVKWFGSILPEIVLLPPYTWSGDTYRTGEARALSLKPGGPRQCPQ